MKQFLVGKLTRRIKQDVLNMYIINWILSSVLLVTCFKKVSENVILRPFFIFRMP